LISSSHLGNPINKEEDLSKGQRHKEEMEEAQATTLADRVKLGFDMREGGNDFRGTVVSSKITKASKEDRNWESIISSKEGSTYDLLTQFS
jgi:hypothetical protein